MQAVCKRVGSLRYTFASCHRQPGVQWPYLHGLNGLEPTGPDWLRSKSTVSPLSQRRTVEKLWQKFFSDPSQWWDNRAGKRNPRYPDFKHKKTGQGLWVTGQWNPVWVETKIASLAPGAFHLNLFSWNSLLGKYTKDGQYEKTLQVFQRMQERRRASRQGQKALDLSQQMQEAGHQPDPLTFVGVLNACANIGALQEGKNIHSQIIHSGCEAQVFVGSSLVNMYAKCGSIDDAWMVFRKMPEHDMATWNSMILGFAKSSRGQKALELFWEMRKKGLHPTSITFIAVLNACASIGALEEGKRIHAQIIQTGCQNDVFVVSSLIDMYAKCGTVQDAWTVFRKISFLNDRVVWSAMLGGFAMHGQANKALRLFEVMCEEGILVDKVILVQLLSACSHAGLVDESLYLFDAVTSLYSISPAVEHYTCMVDLLGRAGRLQEAEDMIRAFEDSDAVMWKALLAACRVHGNAEMGERVAHRVLALEPDSSSGYSLLSNIYAAAGNFEGSNSVHERRMKLGVKKQPGRTWIEVNNQVHSFTADDDEHPESVVVHGEWRKLSTQLEEAGFEANSSELVHHADDEGKMSPPSQHSEKLALAFGLIHTSRFSVLRMYKNLRICGDCHASFKSISKMLGRELIVRDVIRFHHFKDGVCSCGDFW